MSNKYSNTSYACKGTMPEVFDNEMKWALSYSREISLEMKCSFIAIEHLALGILRLEGGKYTKNALNINWKNIADELYIFTQKKYPAQEIDEAIALPLTQSAQNTLVISVYKCKLSQRAVVTTQDLLLAILHHHNDVKVFFRKHAIDHNILYDGYINSPSRKEKRLVYICPLKKRKKLTLSLRLFKRLYLI